jgi:hypothetical protein
MDTDLAAKHCQPKAITPTQHIVGVMPFGVANDVITAPLIATISNPCDNPLACLALTIIIEKGLIKDEAVIRGSSSDINRELPPDRTEPVNEHAKSCQRLQKIGFRQKIRNMHTISHV